MASQEGYDLSAITGTGPNGRVIAADVKEYVPATADVSMQVRDDRQSVSGHNIGGRTGTLVPVGRFSSPSLRGLTVILTPQVDSAIRNKLNVCQ